MGTPDSLDEEIVRAIAAWRGWSTQWRAAGDQRAQETAEACRAIVKEKLAFRRMHCRSRNLQIQSEDAKDAEASSVDERAPFERRMWG